MSPRLGGIVLVVVGLALLPTRRASAATTRPAAEKVPVLLDTDLGTDAADAFALALAVASDEIDLRGVTTAGRNAEDRAWMACRFLTHAGRKDVPVAWGRGEQPGPAVGWQIQYRRHPAVVWDRTAKPAKAPAVDLLYDRLKADPGKVTLVSIGPPTNVARLFEAHPDCKPWVRHVILVDPTADPDAGNSVLRSGVPVTIVPAREVAKLRLDDTDRRKLFAACTPLTYQVQALYELWDESNAEPPAGMGDALAIALAFSDEFCRAGRANLMVEDKSLEIVSGKPNCRLVTAVDAEKFARWYVDRVAGFGESALPKPPGNESKLVDRGGLPNRVHAFEDYETDIEKRWWMSGKPETKDIPLGGRRACRGVLTQDFDDRMGDMRANYRAVVFNPVPGPPMGKNTRLAFRYKLHGTDTLRVQLFSLSNGYHRYLSVKGLPQDRWEEGAVDMTQMRRPDGTGGPLSEDERIDDIQFYVDPRADLLIDDMVLYDAAPAEEKRPFPKRILYTGWFDTGKQGQEWPGEFEIVKHDPPLTWKAAKAVTDATTGEARLRLGLRGMRPLGGKTELRFRYRVNGADRVDVSLVNSKTGQHVDGAAESLVEGEWAETTAVFGAGPGEVDTVRFVVPKGAGLLVDDVLLYEPAPP